MSKNYVTKKGSVLPLMNLKGKEYMMVAHRLVWLVDEEPNYTTNLEFLILKEDVCLAKMTLTLFDETGNVVKSVQDCKMEHKKDFPDFVEKAITGSLGRCLAQIGKGTSYALQDLDEGARIVDTPLADVKQQLKAETVAAPQEAKAPEATKPVEAPKKVATFRKPKTESAAPATTSEAGWE